MSQDSESIDIMKIMSLIPHRYPMLLIDRIIEIDGCESGIGLKNVTINEPYFVGHFANYPVVPGVLLIESIAQIATVIVSMYYLSQSHSLEDYLPYFMSIERVKFRKPVVPGDTMILKVQKVRRIGDSWKYQGKIFVNEVLCTEAICTAVFMKRNAFIEQATRNKR